MQNTYNEKLFETLEKQGINISDQYKKQITTKIDQIVNYEPRVGVFGKTGVGKSSLCNSVFGRDVCKISDVKACTREPQEVLLSIGKNGLRLIDVPGVGESRERDQEYAALYQKILPELDLVLWVLKGDDRAFTSDETFYKQVVKPHINEGKPFFIVLNQVDKIEPFREWNEDARHPGVRQSKNIEEKRLNVAAYFDLPLEQIIPVSANEKYGLINLVDSIVHALPDEKKVTILREIKKENRSEKAKKEAEEGFVKSVIDVAVDILPIPAPMKGVAKKALKAASEWKIWPWNWFD